MTAPAPKPAARTQQAFVVTKENPSTAATLALKSFVAERACIIDAVHYINPTGLASDASNLFVGVCKKGTTQFAAVFDTTLTTGTGLAADTYLTATLDADSTKRVFAAGDVLTFTMTKTGTQTLPAGTLQVSGRYL